MTAWSRSISTAASEGRICAATMFSHRNARRAGPSPPTQQSSDEFCASAQASVTSSTAGVPDAKPSGRSAAASSSIAAIRTSGSLSIAWMVQRSSWILIARKDGACMLPVAPAAVLLHPDPAGRSPPRCCERYRGSRKGCPPLRVELLNIVCGQIGKAFCDNRPGQSAKRRAAERFPLAPAPPKERGGSGFSFECRARLPQVNPNSRPSSISGTQRAVELVIDPTAAREKAS